MIKKTGKEADKKEMLILKKLDHPYVIKLMDCCETKKRIFMVLEYCYGGAVSDNLKQKKPLLEKEAAHIIRKVSEGLKYAKCKFVGWIHGDLQYDMKILFQVIEILENSENQNHNILIKGRRAKRKFSEDFFTVTMSIVASIFLRKVFIDINAQPSFFSRKILQDFKNVPKDLMLDLYIYNLINKIKNKKIIRIPVVQKERERGQSSWNKNFASKFLLSYKMLKGIIKLI